DTATLAVGPRIIGETFALVPACVVTATTALSDRVPSGIQDHVAHPVELRDALLLDLPHAVCIRSARRQWAVGERIHGAPSTRNDRNGRTVQRRHIHSGRQNLLSRKYLAHHRRDLSVRATLEVRE